MFDLKSYSTEYDLLVKRVLTEELKLKQKQALHDHLYWAVRLLEPGNLSLGTRLVLWGLLKKRVLADRMGGELW